MSRRQSKKKKISSVTATSPATVATPKRRRTDTSLGVLSTKFMQLFGKDGHVVDLSAAMAVLGTSRRRMYDIVNVLEAVGFVSLLAKGKYVWGGLQGFRAIVEKLQRIVDGKEDPPNGSFQFFAPVKPVVSAQPHPKAVKVHKTKSIGMITQKFIRCFLADKTRLFTQEQLSAEMTGMSGVPASDAAPSAYSRRLYDICNILCAVRVIEKIQLRELRKTAFRWVGAGAYTAVAGTPTSASNPTSLSSSSSPAPSSSPPSTRSTASSSSASSSSSSSSSSASSSSSSSSAAAALLSVARAASASASSSSADDDTITVDCTIPDARPAKYLYDLKSHDNAEDPGSGQDDPYEALPGFSLGHRGDRHNATAQAYVSTLNSFLAQYEAARHLWGLHMRDKNAATPRQQPFVGH